MKDSNQYIKLFFPQNLILDMLRIRHYKKTLAIHIHIYGVHCIYILFLLF